MNPKQNTDKYFDDKISKIKKERNIVITLIIIVGVIMLSLTLSSYTISPRIIVYSQHRRIILTPSQIKSLQDKHILSIQKALYNYRFGGTIRNNDVADIIIDILK